MTVRTGSSTTWSSNTMEVGGSPSDRTAPHPGSTVQSWRSLGAWLVACLLLGSCRDSLVGTPEATADKAASSNAAIPPAVAAAVPPPSVAPPSPAPEARAPGLVAGGSARGRYGMVVSVELSATQVGVRMLEMGGNAVDAAVATAYALAVTHPSAGNVGGGGFMLIARRGEPVFAIDFRERAPERTTVPRFLSMLGAGAKGPAASAVPGSVAGLNLAQQRFGLLPLDQVILPAVELARRGHRLGARQAEVLAQAWPELRRDPAARRIFGNGNAPLEEGARLTQKDLADTLEAIARQGDAGFYAGPTARRIEAAMGERGLIRERDLSAYRAVVREPLRFGYRGFDVTTMPPPSSGGLAVAQIASLLERLGAERAPAGSADDLHLFVEASKRVQARRRFELVDPDSDPEGMSALGLRQRLTPEALAALTPPIELDRATPAADVYALGRDLAPELPHTTHLSVVDALGNAVSCTVTLSSSFGARYVVPGTGVVMNNSLAAFGGSGLNVPKPGRRMLSSMAPTLVSRQGDVLAVLGSPGGDSIPSTVVQILRHLIDHGMSIDRAVEAPRVHHGFTPDLVRIESTRPFEPSVLSELEARGHEIAAVPSMGDANNIVVVDGVAYGHADTREGGLALGPSRLPPATQSGTLR
jgi:gamma-glutamyltranspeptidase / glutathione hydrolase